VRQKNCLFHFLPLLWSMSKNHVGLTATSQWTDVIYLSKNAILIKCRTSPNHSDFDYLQYFKISGRLAIIKTIEYLLLQQRGKCFSLYWSTIFQYK
jgi:hypothetical protein